ncbi:hypothetical protein FQR65_LT13372 [Abscondita terminalis]|nr:hypothetical protein FQR65_LT13372 [Abscondita terminalis]
MNYFLFLLIFYGVGVYGSNFVEDYCWRDYDGDIPYDALKCGTDRAGDPIYVGQVLYENKLIPGKIHKNEAKIHFEFYRAYTANETIKILCVRHPQRFEWVRVKYYEVYHLTSKHLFLGGFERGYDTYIGRANSHGELTVGKVICSPSNCLRLTTIENGTWYDHDEFEILTYNPDAVLYNNPFDVQRTQTFIFALRDVIDDLSKGIQVCYDKLNDTAAEYIGSINEEEYLEEGVPIIDNFYECTFNESGYVNNNEINFDILKQALLKTRDNTKQIVETAIKKCKIIRGISLGDTIVKVLNCLAKNKAIH